MRVRESLNSPDPAISFSFKIRSRRAPWSYPEGELLKASIYDVNETFFTLRVGKRLGLTKNM
jgi:hypothetical protein